MTSHMMVQVEDPKNPNIIFHRTPDPATFPRPPVMLRVVDRETTAVTLSWRKVTILTIHHLYLYFYIHIYIYIYHLYLYYLH